MGIWHCPIDCRFCIFVVVASEGFHASVSSSLFLSHAHMYRSEEDNGVEMALALEATEEKLQRSRSALLSEDTTTQAGARAFVTFLSTRAVQRCLEIFPQRRRKPFASMPAPRPSEVIFENVNISLVQQMARRVIFTGVFLVFCVFFSSPLAVLTTFEEVLFFLYTHVSVSCSLSV